MKRYGYHRTSTKEQHLDRGITEIQNYCITNNLELEKIFTDQQMGKNFGCVPVIAHVNRYMKMLRDNTLIQRVRERDMIVQVNANYFLDPKTVKAAIQNLKLGNIQLIGSDCHDLVNRAPNLLAARRQAKAFGAESAFNRLHQNAVDLLWGRGE